MTLVTARALAYAAPDRRVLASGLDFDVGAGEVLLIAGPNGVGKTTLLKVLLGKMMPVAGSLVLGMPREAVSYLPQMQGAAFHLPLTMRDVLRISRGRRFDEGAALAWGLLERSHLDLAWNTASGGEKRRTLMTRALLGEPRLLILDEPLNHLDSATRLQVSRVIERFVTGAQGRAVVLVSHEPPEFSERVRVRTLQLKGSGRDE